MPSSSSPDTETSFSSSGGTFYRSSFWAALLVPFCLDLLVHGQLLTSLFGAAAWTLLITLSSWKPQIRDLRLRSFFMRSEVILWVLFVAAWGFLLVRGVPEHSAWIQPLSRAWLVRIHAFLLAGSAGLVFLFGLSSLAAHYQLKRLESDSWKRRGINRFLISLPSLESLLKVSSMAVFWAFTAWGVGLALAFLTLIVTWGPASQASISALSLALDPKILLTGLLWVVLLAAFVIQNRSPWSPRRRAHWLSGLALIFWVFLSLQAVIQKSSFHEPVRWFLK